MAAPAAVALPCTLELIQDIENRTNDLLGKPREVSKHFPECETCEIKYDASFIVKEIEDLEKAMCGCRKPDAVCDLCGEIDSTKLRPDAKRSRWLCESCRLGK